MLLRFSLALSFMLIPASVLATAQGTNTISGQITDTSRRPVVNMYVELLDEVEMIMKRIKTDGAGRYLFQGVSKGIFYVRIITSGTSFVAPPPERVEVIVISARGGSGGASEERSFTLRTRDEITAAKTGNAGTVFSQSVPPDAQKFYEAAIAKLDLASPDLTGVDDLKKAVESFPNYYLALERLGTEYVKQGKHTEAQEILNKAITVNPKGQMGLYSLGVAQYNLKNYPAAAETMQRAVALSPNSANAQFYLGIALFRDKKFQEAEAPLKKAYELGGKQVAQVHMYLGQIYGNSKRYKEAADELELFLKETPDAQDAANIRKIIENLRAKQNSSN